MGKMKSITTRALTGIVYVGMILGVIISNEVVAVACLLALFSMLGSYEYLVMSKSNLYTLFLKIWHALMAGLVVYIFYILADYPNNWHKVVMALFPYFCYILFYLIGEIYRLKRVPEREASQSFFAHIYVALPLGVLLLTTGERYGLSELFGDRLSFPNTFWLLPIFTLIWLNDTGAYLVGSLFGKHKLLERVSPNKTWEGSIGGMVITLIGSYCYSLLFPEVASVWEWMGFGLLIVFFGTYGDLFESFIKRSCGVKDSGNILPGHGGMLDRIDSLLFVSFPAFLYINLVINV